MTENKAIKILKNTTEHIKVYEEEVSFTSEFAKAYEVAIKALEEIQRYHELGTTAEIIGQQYELQHYRAIGTVEEFKGLKEKAVPKKPIYSDFAEDDDGIRMIPYKASCPTCGYEFNFGEWNDEQNHHCNCGQYIDWAAK